MRNKIKIIHKLIYCLLIISLVQCGSPSEPLSEVDNTRVGGVTENPPHTENESAPIENDPPHTGGEETNTEADPTELFVSNECNRFYWIFKCALEFKANQTHSEQCKKNITALYPDNKDSLSMISAQSRNSENIIKQTWKNFFNQNCKNDVSVTENLKNLD